MKLSDNLIDYTLPTSKPASTASVAGKIFDGKNQFWELEEGDEPSKLVNAIEIDWNSADWSTIPTENVTIPQTIRTTSDLLIAIRNNHIAVTSQATQPVATTSKVIANITTDGYGHVTSSNDITMGNLASSLKTELDKMYEAKQFRQINFSYEQATSYIDDSSYGIINITTSVACDSFEFDNLEDAAYYGYAWECEFERGDDGVSHQIRIWNLSYDLDEYVIPENTIQGHAIASDSAYADSPIKIVQPRQIILNPKTFTVKYYKTFEQANGTFARSTLVETHTYKAYSNFVIANYTDTILNGYSGFKCWNTTVNGDGTQYYANTSTTINSDLTLYTQWKYPKYNIMLMLQNGSITNMAEYPETQSITRNSYAQWHITPNEGYAAPASIVNGDIVNINQDGTFVIKSIQARESMIVVCDCQQIGSNKTYYYYVGWTNPTSDNLRTIVDEKYTVSSEDSTPVSAGAKNAGSKIVFDITRMYNANGSRQTPIYLVVPSEQKIYSLADGSETTDTSYTDTNRTITIDNVEHKVYTSNISSHTISDVRIK